jgi:hypothetical protein
MFTLCEALLKLCHINIPPYFMKDFSLSIPEE